MNDGGEPTITPAIYAEEMNRQANNKRDRYGMPVTQLSEGVPRETFKNPEEYASVPSTPFNYQKPEDLGPTIASYVNSTAERAQKMMIQTGAPDEGPHVMTAAPFTAPGFTTNAYVEGFR